MAVVVGAAEKLHEQAAVSAPARQVPVTLAPPVFTPPADVKLTWMASTDPEFASYLVWRSQTALPVPLLGAGALAMLALFLGALAVLRRNPVAGRVAIVMAVSAVAVLSAEATSRAARALPAPPGGGAWVGEISVQATTTYVDTDVEGGLLFYRVYVLDQTGAVVSSNEERVFGPGLRTFADAAGLRIGTAVHTQGLKDPEYRATLVRDFNLVTPEYELQWPQLKPTKDGPYDWRAGDELVAFAAENDMELMVGLFFDEQIPQWVRDLPCDRTILLETLEAFTEQLVGRYGDVVDRWLVVTEPIDLEDNIYRRCVGDRNQDGIEDHVRWLFEWTESLDPTAKLYLNDFGGENVGEPKAEALYNYVQRLRAIGVPIHGIGLEGHTNARGMRHWINPALMAQSIGRFNAAGFEVLITELDVGVGTASPSEEMLQLQAEQYRRMVSACINAATCKDIITWGFTDRFTWRTGDALLLYDMNYRPKPAYYAISNLLRAHSATGRR